MLPTVHCYGDDMMILLTLFKFWQNLLNLSEIHLPPASDIIFLGKPYSEEIIIHASS